MLKVFQKTGFRSNEAIGWKASEPFTFIPFTSAQANFLKLKIKQKLLHIQPLKVTLLKTTATFC